MITAPCIVGWALGLIAAALFLLAAFGTEALGPVQLVPLGLMFTVLAGGAYHHHHH